LAVPVYAAHCTHGEGRNANLQDSPRDYEKAEARPISTDTKTPSKLPRNPSESNEVVKVKTLFREGAFVVGRPSFRRSAVHVYVADGKVDAALKKLKKRLVKKGVLKDMRGGDYAMSRGQRKRAKHTKVLARLRKYAKRAAS
jgi:ribosomal protein S21